MSSFNSDVNELVVLVMSSGLLDMSIGYNKFLQPFVVREAARRRCGLHAIGGGCASVVSNDKPWGVKVRAIHL